VNLQGDEPLIEPEAVERLVAVMQQGGVEMATLARTLEAEELSRPQVVKVVTDLAGDALYFSRAAIPHRGRGRLAPGAGARGRLRLHRRILERFASLPPDG